MHQLHNGWLIVPFLWNGTKALESILFAKDMQTITYSGIHNANAENILLGYCLSKQPSWRKPMCLGNEYLISIQSPDHNILRMH